jgi:hypothetical protein
MSRSSAEATGLVHTRVYKVQDLIAWEGVRLSQQVQSGQSPVQTIETQMLGEPVLELVFALQRVSAAIVGWRRATGWKRHAPCRGSGCSERVCLQKAAFRRAGCLHPLDPDLIPATLQAVVSRLMVEKA